MSKEKKEIESKEVETKAKNYEEDISEENYYIDFIIEGSGKASKSDIDRLKKKMSRIVTKLLEQEETIKLNVNISTFSELELALTMGVLAEGNGGELH